jgi:hypothetical protein
VDLEDLGQQLGLDAAVAADAADPEVLQVLAGEVAPALDFKCT